MLGAVLLGAAISALIMALIRGASRPGRALRAAGICVLGAVCLALPIVMLSWGLGRIGDVRFTTLTAAGSWALVPAAMGFALLAAGMWVRSKAGVPDLAPLLRGLVWMTAIAYGLFRVAHLVQLDQFWAAIHDTPREAKWTQFETTMPLVALLGDIAMMLALITMVSLLASGARTWMKHRNAL